VPYGPAGGSGQVASAMAKAVTDLTDVDKKILRRKL
jgi:hypothetical protein